MKTRSVIPKKYYVMSSQQGDLYAEVTGPIRDSHGLEVTCGFNLEKGQTAERCQAKIFDHRKRLGDCIGCHSRSEILASWKLVEIIQHFTVMPTFRFIPTTVMDGRRSVAEFVFPYTPDEWERWDAVCLKRSRYTKGIDGLPLYLDERPVVFGQKLAGLDFLSIIQCTYVVSDPLREAILSARCENVMFEELRVV